MRIYFWGIGLGSQKALKNYLGKEEIDAFIDNNPALHDKEYCGKKIIYFKEAVKDNAYIIVTVKKYEAITYQLKQEGFFTDKIICYYDFSTDEKKIGVFFDVKGWKIDILEYRIEELERLINIRFHNCEYEISDKIRKGKYEFPVIHDDGEAIERIINEKASMIRFGDGEFEIMRGNDIVNFQKYEKKLAIRLKEIIQSDKRDILIGIANNYGDIDIYSDEIADGIREYMTYETREFHMSVLKPDKVYYNAYMFKCYYPFRDKTKTQKRVKLVKRIWDDRDVILIEGAETRTGQGNDLLDNAKSVKRIVCPTKNAFSYYQEILETTEKLPKDNLILCVLGPAGKVLAYDLVNNGYQVVDIGQIDMDYEWYRVGIGKKVQNPTKYVSQLPPAEVEDVEDERYYSQIIACIGRGTAAESF